jgi:hypothetical protein
MRPAGRLVAASEAQAFGEGLMEWLSRRNRSSYEETMNAFKLATSAYLQKRFHLPKRRGSSVRVSDLSQAGIGGMFSVF